MIYFRCYIEAYDDATAEISALEDGMYFRLLRYYYRKEKPLSNDSDELARVCKAIKLEEQAAIAAVLDRFFIQKPDGWHNERADHEIAVSRTARENGSRGGRPAEQETGTRTGKKTGSKTGDVTDEITERQTRDVTGSGQPFSLSTKTIPSTSQPLNQPPSADAARRGRKAPPGETNPVWEAYSSAYVQRYGVAPVRNARVNGQLASLVRCVGVGEAPDVAAFYVRHNRADYVRATHPAGMLAKDAEGLRTAWARGHGVSDTEARQADRTMATGNAFAPLIEAAKAKERV